MNLKSKHKADPSFNMSSMTDIVFLLLIFFMLTSSVTTSGIKINLPSNTKKSQLEPKSVRVAIDEDLNYFVNSNPVSKTQLKKVILQELEGVDPNSKDYKVVVKGDKSIKYDDVMQVVALVSEIGSVKVTLATDITK